MLLNKKIFVILFINIIFLSNYTTELLYSSNFSGLVEKPLVVVILSYNNVNYYQKNIDSVLRQKYENYRVIYVDDCSIDGMSDEALFYIEKNDREGRWTYLRNSINCGAMHNLYHAIHSCADHEIIVSLDGDDWFKHENVLGRVNYEYADENIWMTYGQYEWLSSGDRGHADTIAKKFRDDWRHLRRQVGSLSSLRTYYAWLFKKIKYEDLCYQGNFFSSACDVAILSPMMEMASPDHFKFIDEVLYVYNDMNPINEFRIRNNEQHDVGKYVLSLPPYEPLDKSFFHD